MKFCLIIISIFSFQLLALEVSREKDKIILRDPSCKDLIDTVQSLSQWTNNINEQSSCPPLSTTHKNNQELCEFDITQCIPAHVKNFQGVVPEFAGPNCWNLALVMKGILPNLRYTTPEEMAFYMQPPLCRQLKNNEKKIPGDLGAIRSIKGTFIKETEEYHGFIYISDKVAYSKNGSMNINPYSLQTLDNVFKVYGVPEKSKCRENELNYSKDCPLSVSYFRCISMDDYLKNNQNMPEKIMSALNTVKIVEDCLQGKAIHGNDFSDSAIEVIAQSAKVLTFYLEEEIKNNSNKKSKTEQEKQNFLLGSMQLRLAAISEQLMMSHDYNLSDEVMGFSRSIKRSLDELKGN